MTLEELRALAKPGSQLEIFVQGLDARLPFPKIPFAVNKMDYKEIVALATFLYETFGLTVMVHDWRIQEDSNHSSLLRHLPLTPEDCRYLIDREIDNEYMDVIRKAFPHETLPLELYRQFSFSFQSRCLRSYTLSGLILDDEYGRVDHYIETLERDDLYEWLNNLMLALSVGDRCSDSLEVQRKYEQLGFRWP